MMGMLRMDLYRLVRGKALWVCLAVVIGLVAFYGIAAVSSTASNFAESGDVQIGVHANETGSAGTEGAAGENAQVAGSTLREAMKAMTPIAFAGNLLIAGGALATLFVIFMAIFLAAEFESGFSKNIFSSQRSRGAFLVSKLITVLLTALLFTLVGFGASMILGLITGFGLAAISFGEIVLWLALVTLLLTAFGMLVALIAWFARRMSAAVVAGILLATGLVMMLVKSFFYLFPSLVHVPDYTLHYSMTSLAGGLDMAGGLSSLHIAGVGIAFLALYAILSLVVLKKKDVC